MSGESDTIPKHPNPTAAGDYLRLRREGIELIGKLGSQSWTDYNTHDPGITILELLAYVITDLSYRIGWDDRDLLDNAAKQPFFTPREILTVNPVTQDDYRRLLIDLGTVRNAWAVCRDCSCDTADVAVKGLYDMWLELEADDLVGDLNDRMITSEFTVTDVDGDHEVKLEARFPEWALVDQATFDEFLALDPDQMTVTCTRFVRVRTGVPAPDPFAQNDELRRHWRDVFFASLQIASSETSTVFSIPDVSIRIFSSIAGKNATTTGDVIAALTDSGDLGVVPLYHAKLNLIQAAVEEARKAYHSHRNLDEDLCDIGVVGIEHVAICADVEATPEADLERVQALIWLAIENYLNPPIPFYSMAELLAEGYAVEDIFNGPALKNGFIKQEDLDAAQLKTELRTSDIVNLLMDIEGVVSVSGLQMSSYDDDGKLRTTEDWVLGVRQGYQPRLYFSLSNFIFAKNGLPFALRQDEVFDTLIQLRGATERPKQPGAPNDLKVPAGVTRDAADLSPAQYALPLTYGIGPEGLPGHVGDARRAQARQLKAYLMVYEQLLGNAFQQVASYPKLFSLDPDVDRTYCYYEFDGDQLTGYDDVVGLASSTLGQLVETTPEFHDRRNVFLDHIMARFGASFAEYALLLTNWKGERLAQERLITDKLGFLESYPEISSGRFKAFDHRHQPTLPSNETILKRRISLLLGFPKLAFSWIYDTPENPTTNITSYSLVDPNKGVWLEGAFVFGPDLKEAVTREAANALLRGMSSESAYQIQSVADGHRLAVVSASSTEIGAAPQSFASVSEAEEFAEELAAWAAGYRSVIVEHLLLRPKFPGDALYQECDDCEDADPWSFRLTIVMPGWSAPYNSNLDLRDFADRTIREEIPSHLLAKICWVGNDGYEADECDPVVDELTDLFQEQAETPDGALPDCAEARACATAVYEAHVSALLVWYEEHKLQAFRADEVKSTLEGLLSSLQPADTACTLNIAPIWAHVQGIIISRFVDIVLTGYQFDRFEEAWYAWLRADAAFDWGQEALSERLKALLRRGARHADSKTLCECAKDLLETYGEAFRVWMSQNIAQGSSLEEFTPFAAPAVELCSDVTFLPGTESAVQAFLDERYTSYVEVSYRLSILVRTLESLTNVYPSATLHDCEDGSDDNPVRLNQTALGSLTHRSRT